MLRTDHAPLTWLYGVKEPEDQVANWLEQLQELDFKIIHPPKYPKVGGTIMAVITSHTGTIRKAGGGAA